MKGIRNGEANDNMQAFCGNTKFSNRKNRKEQVVCFCFGKGQSSL